MATEKKRIPAKDLANDVKRGLSPAALAVKYGISERQIPELLQRLVQAGSLTEQDLPRPMPPPAGAPEVHTAGSPAERHWTCPACGAAGRRQHDECPSCGVIVEKFRAMRQGTEGDGVTTPQIRRSDSATPVRVGGFPSLLTAGISVAVILVLVMVADLLIIRAVRSRVAEGLKEMAAIAPTPSSVTLGRISVSPLLGGATLEDVRFTQRNGTRVRAEVSVDRIRITFTSRLVAPAIALGTKIEARDSRDHVEEIQFSGIRITSEDLKAEMTISQCTFRSELNKRTPTDAVIITGFRMEPGAAGELLGEAASALAELSVIDTLSCTLEAKTGKNTKINARLQGPTIEADLDLEAVISTADPANTDIKHARLTVSRMSAFLRQWVGRLEQILGRPFPRVGDRVVIDLRSTWVNLATAGIPMGGGKTAGETDPGRHMSDEEPAEVLEHPPLVTEGMEPTAPASDTTGSLEQETVTGQADDSETEELPEGAIALTYSDKGFPLGLSVSQGSGLHLFESPAPGQGFKKLPPQTGAKRYYDEFAIAGKKFLVLTEASSPPRIYLDANGNGDLTDDPGPFAGEAQSIAPNHYTLLIPYEGERTGARYRMWLFPSRMGGLRFYPECHWHGQVDVNGKAYRLVLFDANADGDYSDNDAVIDVDEDGKAGETERLRPGQSVNIDGTVVKLLSIAPSGRWVRLEMSGPAGTAQEHPSQ